METNQRLTARIAKTVKMHSGTTTAKTAISLKDMAVGSWQHGGGQLDLGIMAPGNEVREVLGSELAGLQASLKAEGRFIRAMDLLGGGRYRVTIVPTPPTPG